MLVNIDSDTLLIPNVAIHMQRNANDGMSYNPQVDMIPLMGSMAAKGELKRLVAQAAGVKPGDIAGNDLYPLQQDERHLVGSGFGVRLCASA